MADPIDDLESIISSSVDAEILPAIYSAIDQWRRYHGGCRAYIAKHSIGRRHQAIINLTQEGIPPADVAQRVGVCQATVRRVARSSSYVS
jgi:DNA-binding NarL/FixJ family response regulator